jgi:peptide chain release factor 1
LRGFFEAQNVFGRLNEIRGRYDELESQLGDPQIAGNPKEYQRIAKEHGRLQQIVQTYSRWEAVGIEMAENRELMGDSDPDMRAMAKEEFARLEVDHEELGAKIKMLLIPPDPLDAKNVFLEIRAGTGGEEAALFAATLFRMYQRYADRVGWKIEIANTNETDKGGFREIVLLISGDQVYSHLKYESGTHRVQRVPETESQGRIHTSAATVAVLPEAEDVEVHINDSDLRIDTFRASGAGGQHVNRTDSAVRITHIPTGTVVECQDERSQHKNKARAMKVLQSRILEQQRREHDAAIASDRKSQVGSGDRSERIRTYNFPQSRITDHRIGFTTHRMEQVLEGDLDELLEPLRTVDQMDKLKELESN